MAYWRDKPQSVEVLAQGVGTAVTGTTDQTTLVSYSMPGGTMGANDQIVVETIWSYTNSVNDKTLRVVFGGTTFQGVLATTTAAARLTTVIANDNNTAVQNGFTASNNVGFGIASGASPTGTVDTTQDVTIAITGQLESSAESIDLVAYRIVLNRAP